MAEYKSRRERRKSGKAVSSEKPAGIALIIGVAKKPKKKDGGYVEGAVARSHLGKRARGGRAEGGATDKNWSSEQEESDLDRIRGEDQAQDKPRYDSKKFQVDDPRMPKKARGGALDAREAAFDSDGVDKVAVGSGKDEREVPIEERAQGGWIGPAREKMEKKGTVGSLHTALHVPQGERIPSKRLADAMKTAGPNMRKKIQFAENVRK